MPITRTTLLAKTTQTAATANAGVDVSGITGDFTIKIRVDALSPNAGSAKIQIEESTNSFTNAYTVFKQDFLGGLPPEGVTVSYRKYQSETTSLAGTASAKFRVNLIELNGTSPSITYEAWIEG
jgi:hypothetical protein